jgi:hypothetical protein
MGTFEVSTAATLNSSYLCGHAGVIARVGGSADVITATTPLAGFLAFYNAAAALASGYSHAFSTAVVNTSYPWSFGLVMPVGTVTQGIRIGNWVGSGTAGSAIPFSTAQNFYADGQLDIIAAYGESVSDLTNAISAKVARFRHLIVGSSLQVNHETYGTVSQLVAKSASLLHMHAGLMGTLEANTTAVVANGAYAYSVAAVIARIGGTNLITATKAVAGFSAIHNGAALASGSSIAFAACAASTGNWTYLLAADNCDNLFYAATGTAYECSAKIATQLTSNAYPKMDGVIRINIGGTAYYVPFYAAGNIDNE